MHLSPYVCEGLRLGASASTRRPNELQVAWSVDVLVHESRPHGPLQPRRGADRGVRPQPGYRSSCTGSTGSPTAPPR